MIRLITALLCAASAATADGISGTVTASDGAAVGLAYVGLMTPGFEPVTFALTRPNGAFTLGQRLDNGLLIVQPPAAIALDGVKTFAASPRIYRLDERAELALELPLVNSIVLCAYDQDGLLRRWRDFEALGKLGGQFAYATNLQDEAQPATVWPVHGDLTGQNDGSREEGLPCILVPPGQSYAVRVLFWPVPTYGKLMLSADNGGEGFRFDAAGAGKVINLNAELARTAVQDLMRRQDKYAASFRVAAAGLEVNLQAALQIEDEPAKAKAADAVLAQALFLRDQAELDAARRSIPETRMGTLAITLDGTAEPEAYRIELTQVRHDFLFGVFEGSPYNAQAFETAREAGFEYATILPAWNWTQSPKTKRKQIDDVFGISRLKDLGYLVKAHGVLWMQEYGILPDRAMNMAHDDLYDRALEHQEALLDVFGNDLDVIEAMNEPAATNVVKMPRERMIQLLGASGKNIREIEKKTLVNSPHEFSYGAKYLVHSPDGAPADDYPLTYSAFLDLAKAEGALDEIDVIGLQFYPGFRFNEGWDNLQGPAYTPAHMLDTIDHYARFGKTLHVTEFSIPSSYGEDWYSGYWQGEWNETLQADFAEAAYTLAFAHPQVESITWWDVMDTKPSVVTGGLLHSDGSAKPVFERLSALIKGWTSHEELQPDSEGQAEARVYAGAYTVALIAADGTRTESTAHVTAGAAERLTLKVGQ